MNPISKRDMLGAAAYAKLGERWLATYLHDLRGELQAMRSAIELLTRTAKPMGQNDPAVERISALAVRTMNNHETSLVKLVNRLTPHSEEPVPLDVAASLSEVLKFVRSDAWNKSIGFRQELTRGIIINVQPETFRLSVLAVISMTLDGLERDSVVDIAVENRQGNAVIEFKSALPCPVVTDPEEFLPGAGASIPTYEMLLGLTGQWLVARGGRLELESYPDTPCVLRMYHPIAPA